MYLELAMRNRARISIVQLASNRRIEMWNETRNKQIVIGLLVFIMAQATNFLPVHCGYSVE